MRIYCSDCESKSIIVRTTGNTLICICSNEFCGHTFHTEIYSKYSDIKFKLERLRIICECGEKVRIIKTHTLSPKVTNLYCKCSYCDLKFSLVRVLSQSIVRSQCKMPAQCQNH